MRWIWPRGQKTHSFWQLYLLCVTISFFSSSPIYLFTVKTSSHACTLQLFWTFNISGCCGTWFWLFREISWGNKVLLFPIHTKTTLPLYKTSEESMHTWLVSGVEEETMWRETHSSRSAHNLQITRAEIFKLSFKHCTKPCWSFRFWRALDRWNVSSRGSSRALMYSVLVCLIAVRGAERPSVCRLVRQPQFQLCL